MSILLVYVYKCLICDKDQLSKISSTSSCPKLLKDLSHECKWSRNNMNLIKLIVSFEINEIHAPFE